MVKFIRKEHVQTFTKCTTIDEQKDMMIKTIDNNVHYIELVKQGATFIGNLFKITYLDENGVERHNKMLLSVGMAKQNPSEKFERNIGIDLAAERSWAGDTIIEMEVNKYFNYNDFVDLVMEYYYRVCRPAFKPLKYKS